MAAWNPLALLLLTWMSACLPCVSAGNVVPLVASGAVCAVMLVVVIAMAIIAFIWPDLKRGWIKRNRKVKIPKVYARKKEEAKSNLINGSIGSRSPSTYNTPFPNKTADTEMSPHRASWVQDWHQERAVPKDAYEEQDVTMELGDEMDKEFKIETYVVDNEVLDVGPYKDTSLSTSAQPASGNVYSDPYIYITGDRAAATIIKSSEATGGMVSSISRGQEMNEIPHSSVPVENPAYGLNDHLVKL